MRCAARHQVLSDCDCGGEVEGGVPPTLRNEENLARLQRHLHGGGSGGVGGVGGVGGWFAVQRGVEDPEPLVQRDGARNG